MTKKSHTEIDCIQETSIALIKQQMQNIESKLDNVTDTMEDFIKEIRTSYTTKEEYKNLKTDYVDFKNKMWVINLAILVALIGGVFAVILK
jgi:DNA-binding transcriptional regulator GbsR (MarR family)